MLSIVPTPLFAEVHPEHTLQIESLSLGNCPLHNHVQTDFTDYLAKISIPTGNAAVVQWVKDNTLDQEEYQLEITDTVRITTGSIGGGVFALQTLKQILFLYGQSLPYLVIKDKPQHKVRKQITHPPAINICKIWHKPLLSKRGLYGFYPFYSSSEDSFSTARNAS